MDNFKDAVFYDNENEKVISYRSGLTVYEEKFECGMLTAEGRNGAGFMLNVQDDLPTRFGRNRFAEPQSFDFLADGFSLSGTWEFISFDKEIKKLENGTEVLSCVTRLKSTLKPVNVFIETSLDGTEVIERSFRIENSGQTPLAISDVTVSGGGLEILQDWNKYGNEPDYNKIYDIIYPEYCQWGHEGMLRRHPITKEGTFIPGKYMCDRHRHPMFILRNLLTGSVFNCQLAFSGGFRFSFFLDICDNDALLSWKAKLDGVNPFVVLQSGESYTVPSVHMGYLQGDIDDAVNAMNRHFRKSVFTLPAARGLSSIVSGGMGPERVMDFKALKHGVDTFAKLGAETMIVDAGWYCKAGDEIHEWHRNMGDWFPDEGKHPNGLKEIADYIHSKGLLFGLWLDLESAGANSTIYKNRPDWMLKTKYGEQTTILDMTNPEVAAWAESELTRVIRDYKIDLFRLDNNTHFRDFQTRVGEIPQSVYSKYYAAVYAMYERLRRAFPDVVFENCAGGGGRTDIGLVKYFTHTWVSDWQKMPRGVAITNGMTMCLPPEYVDRLSGGMDSHIRGSLPIIMRHAIFGKPTVNIFNPVGTEYNEQQLEFIKHTLDIYKEFIRPFAKDGLIFHHTPEFAGEEPVGNCVIERSSAERDRSIIGVFRLGGTPDDGLVTVFPRGIKPEGRYEVTFDNAGSKATVEGFELCNKGINVRLHAALSSELILIKKYD